MTDPTDNMRDYPLHNRPEREIRDHSEVQEILKKGKFCIISLCRDNEPYIVTLSYGYDELGNSLFFHCARQGLKMDFLRHNPNVCATVIEDGGYVMNECGHNFRSVVFWGNLQSVTDMEEKKHGMKILLRHLETDSATMMEKLNKSDESYSKMEVLRLDITQIHGKAGR